MQIDLIGFDADDTLWQTEIYYIQALYSLENILTQWESTKNINEIMDQIQIKNLPQYGYGVKAFLLSMIETAVHISNGEIRGEQIDQVLKIGKEMLAKEVILRPYVQETVKHLSLSYRLMILTKGDLLDQTKKVARSHIANYFFAVEVVNEKNPVIYAKVLDKYQVDPSNFLMIGNSIRSDVEPVLKLGGTTVHIPAKTTWKHELVPNFDTTQERFYSLEHISHLPELIKKISDDN